MARTVHPPARNPLNTTDGGMVRGETPFQPGSPHRERGVILSVDSQRHAYRVSTSSGRTLDGVGRLRSSPSDTSLLAPGTPVRVDFSLGQPYIDGVLPSEVPVSDQQNTSVTGTSGYGGQDNALNRNMGGSFRDPRDPNDLMPGDHVFTSPDGAAVGALHGKVAMMSGSPLAAIRAFGATDTVEIIAGIMRVVTWMGESKFLNEDGKVSFQWRGGSDQLTETGPDEERYTLRLDLGHRGDLVNFAVTTPDGQPVFRIHVTANGRVTVMAAEGVSSTLGNGTTEHLDQVHANRTVVTEGNHTERVSGDVVHDHEGSSTRTVSQNDIRISVRNRVDQVGGTKNLKVSGDVIDNIGGKRTETIVGDVEQLAQHNVVRIVLMDETVNVTQTHKINAATEWLNSPDVKFGPNPVSHAVKYEELQAEMARMNVQLNLMRTALQSHTHPYLIPPSPTPLMTAPSLTLLSNPGMMQYNLNLTGAKVNSVRHGP